MGIRFAIIAQSIFHYVAHVQVRGVKQHILVNCYRSSMSSRRQHEAETASQRRIRKVLLPAAWEQTGGVRRDPDLRKVHPLD